MALPSYKSSGWAATSAAGAPTSSSGLGTGPVAQLRPGWQARLARLIKPMQSLPRKLSCKALWRSP